MVWKLNFSTTEKYPTTVHKFLVNYLRGGEGRSRAKHVVGGISEAVEVDGMLRGWRWWRAPREVVEVEGEAIERRRG
jgi:hypothetical protein